MTDASRRRRRRHDDGTAPNQRHEESCPETGRSCGRNETEWSRGAPLRTVGAVSARRQRRNSSPGSYVVPGMPGVRFVVASRERFDDEHTPSEAADPSTRAPGGGATPGAGSSRREQVHDSCGATEEQLRTAGSACSPCGERAGECSVCTVSTRGVHQMAPFQGAAAFGRPHHSRPSQFRPTRRQWTVGLAASDAVSGVRLTVIFRDDEDEDVPAVWSAEGLQDRCSVRESRSAPSEYAILIGSLARAVGTSRPAPSLASRGQGDLTSYP